MSLAARVARIEREVMRHSEVRAAVADAAAVTTGTLAKLGLGAALFSPFMLIGAAGGLVKDLSAASVRNEMADKTRRDSAKICVRDWNFLVRMIVPALARRTLARLRPERELLAECLVRHLEGAKGKKGDAARAAVASRIARLLNFPLTADAPGGRPRGEALRRIRELLRDPPPRTFAPLD